MRQDKESKDQVSKVLMGDDEVQEREMNNISRGGAGN
jgi:translation elongation factor EF-1beta